ncbi:HAD family hydrolase [Bacteriovoracaceae bacterium]|nr:HAD family hydrolase [Bacteriovoracaceae bacterium]
MIDFDKYDSFFFDCDGVILDSNKIKTEAFYDIALPYGENIAKDFVEYHKANGGVSRFEKCRYLIEDLVGQSGNQESIDDAVQRFAVLVKERLIKSAEVEGVTQLLQKLKGKRVYVISGGKQEELREVFEIRGLSRFFTAIYGSPSTKYEIIEALKKSEVFQSPIFFGDSKIDYEVASHYQMDFVFIYGVSEFRGWKQYFDNKKVTILQNFSSN